MIFLKKKASELVRFSQLGTDEVCTSLYAVAADCSSGRRLVGVVSKFYLEV